MKPRLLKRACTVTPLKWSLVSKHAQVRKAYANSDVKCLRQAAVFNELAKIEVQQRVVIQQINALKSERCESNHGPSHRTSRSIFARSSW